MNPIVLIESNNYHQTASFYSVFSILRSSSSCTICSMLISKERERRKLITMRSSFFIANLQCIAMRLSEALLLKLILSYVCSRFCTTFFSSPLSPKGKLIKLLISLPFRILLKITL